MPLRQDHELPVVIARDGWRYHHLGIPTEVRHAGESYLKQFGMYVSGFESSPYGIQWMRFDADSPLDPLIRTVPHVAFEVDDLNAALAGRTLLTPPNSPSAGVRVAMIVDNGAPVELIEFATPRSSRCDTRATSVAGPDPATP